jgi:hypothetical protein
LISASFGGTQLHFGAYCANRKSSMTTKTHKLSRNTKTTRKKRTKNDATHFAWIVRVARHHASLRRYRNRSTTNQEHQLDVRCETIRFVRCRPATFDGVSSTGNHESSPLGKQRIELELNINNISDNTCTHAHVGKTIQIHTSIAP